MRLRRMERSFKPVELTQMNGSNDEVDELNAEKRSDEAANAVEKQVAPKQGLRRHGLVPDPTQCQRNKPDDDQRIEDHCRKNCRLRRLKMYDVQCVEHRKGRSKH